MEPTIIKSKDLHASDFGDTRVTDVFSHPDWPFNIAKVEKLEDDIKTGFNPESDVAYYVLEGEGTAVPDGKEYYVGKGDCILTPKGTKYKNLKGLTLLAFSVPPYDASKRVYVED